MEESEPSMGFHLSAGARHPHFRIPQRAVISVGKKGVFACQSFYLNID
jgi:hypothetical protein